MVFLLTPQRFTRFHGFFHRCVQRIALSSASACTLVVCTARLPLRTVFPLTPRGNKLFHDFSWRCVQWGARSSTLACTLVMRTVVIPGFWLTRSALPSASACTLVVCTHKPTPGLVFLLTPQAITRFHDFSRRCVQRIALPSTSAYTLLVRTMRLTLIGLNLRASQKQKNCADSSRKRDGSAHGALKIVDNQANSSDGVLTPAPTYTYSPPHRSKEVIMPLTPTSLPGRRGASARG